MKPLSLLVLIYSYMSANFNDIRSYSPWSSAVLLRTLWLISVDITAIITIPRAWKLQRYFSSVNRLYEPVKFSGPPFWALSYMYDWSCDACVTCVPLGQRLTEKKSLGANRGHLTHLARNKWPVTVRYWALLMQSLSKGDQTYEWKLRNQSYFLLSLKLSQ